MHASEALRHLDWAVTATGHAHQLDGVTIWTRTKPTPTALLEDEAAVPPLHDETMTACHSPHEEMTIDYPLAATISAVVHPPHLATAPTTAALEEATVTEPGHDRRFRSEEKTFQETTCSEESLQEMRGASVTQETVNFEMIAIETETGHILRLDARPSLAFETAAKSR